MIKDLKMEVMEFGWSPCTTPALIRVGMCVDDESLITCTNEKIYLHDQKYKAWINF